MERERLPSRPGVKEKERGWALTIPFMAKLPMAGRPPARPRLLKVPQPPTGAALGTKHTVLSEHFAYLIRCLEDEKTA